MKDKADIEGVLFVDKPSGPSSHDIVNKVRWISRIRRVGHTGTLDPLASGLLILCLGRATRLAEYVTSLPKSYLATVRLGQETDTFDSEGQVISEHQFNLSAQEIESALSSFRGEIIQIPPKYSAKKINGQPSYKLAREGKEVSIPGRTVMIYKLKLLSWDDPYVELEINCSSGTYIRSLAHDLGARLECGGHITALRRSAIGDFSINDAAPLTSLNRDNLARSIMPLDTAVKHLPRLTLSEEESQFLANGRAVNRQDGQPSDRVVRGYDPDGQFVGVMLLENGFWKAKKIFYYKTAEQLP